MRARRILVVDDDDDICCNLRDILEDLGFEIDTANDGSSAIAFAKVHAYDLVLLDYQMPEMNGDNVYRELLKLRPKVATIMITALANTEGAQRSVDAGISHLLQKPIDVEQLLQLLPL